MVEDNQQVWQGNGWSSCIEYVHKLNWKHILVLFSVSRAILDYRTCADVTEW